MRSASSGWSRSQAQLLRELARVARAHVQPGLVSLDQLAHPAVHVHDRRPPGGERVEQLVGRVGGEHGHVLEERQADDDSAASRATSAFVPSAKLHVRRRGALELGAALAVAHQHEAHVLQAPSPPRSRARGRWPRPSCRSTPPGTRRRAAPGRTGRGRPSSARAHARGRAASAAWMPGDSATIRVLRAYTKRSSARASALRERVAQRAHLDRGLRPEVAHLEHERGAPARRSGERRKRHRERGRGGVDHVGARPAQRGERGAEREAREREHPSGVRERRRAHVVGVRAAHAGHVDPVHARAALPGGYHPHPVTALHEAARELVGARATRALAGDEELMQVEDLHRPAER